MNLAVLRRLLSLVLHPLPAARGDGDRFIFAAF